MFGNGLTCCEIFSLPYRRNHRGDYLVEHVQVQPQLLEVLRDVPTCTGVGVRRDVVWIEEVYTMISGESLELNGFVDLSAISPAVGQEHDSSWCPGYWIKLNKIVSTGDNLWGVPWLKLPPSFHMYGIGDIWFGYICYSVLWNHGRVLLCPTVGEIYYSMFGVNLDQFQDAVWTEPCCNLRGLKRPRSILVNMLEFNPRTVQVAMIGKFGATTGRSQRFAILEWGLVNPEKISEFLHKMKVNKILFRYQSAVAPQKIDKGKISLYYR